MTNPIDNPDFNPSTYREPNPSTIAKLNELAERYHAAAKVPRELRRELDDELRAAKEAGHSYPQLRDATGLSIATIQAVIEKGRQK